MARRAVWSERTRYAVTTRGAPSLLREIETDVVKGCRALLHVLDSNVPTREDALRQITIPTLVAIGDRDERSDAEELAALLCNARFLRVPGGHENAFAAPELAAAMAAFLAER